MHRSSARLSLLLVVLALHTACGAGGLGEGDFGATPGGVQDMRIARELISDGRVPPPEAFVVEGMFSEHDLPLSGSVCERTLCVRAAAAVAPLLDEREAGFAQVGLSSTIDADHFDDIPYTLIATVDVSGSMGWEQGEGFAGVIAADLLHRIIDTLRPIDRMAIVTFGDEAILRQPIIDGDQKELLHAVVDGLSTGGATDMESGMKLAYEVGRAHARGDDERVRVMVFTDVQPNVGATEDSEFETLVREAESDDSIETSVFACGLGVGVGGLQAMSHLRGANGFGVPTLEAAAVVMEESWPFLLEAIAYDLKLDVTLPASLTLGAGYGFPTTDGLPTSSLHVASVFLSKKRGALLLRLDPVQALASEQALPSAFDVEVALSYEERDGLLVEETLHAVKDGEPLDERGQWAAQPSTEKAVALAILVEGMRASADAYATDSAAAIAHIELAVARIESDALAIDDDAIDVEVELARDLRDLMVAGAEQGSLSGEDE